MTLPYHTYKGYTLKCPEDFIWASDTFRDMICNGMGPEGYGWIIPDTMYGLDLGPAGDIHDWMYGYPQGLSRLDIDNIFLENMRAIIKQNGGWSMVQWLRGRRALKYYHAVRLGGDKHFNERFD